MSKISHTIKYIISYIKLIIKRKEEFLSSTQKKCIIDINQHCNLCIYTMILYVGDTNFGVLSFT